MSRNNTRTQRQIEALNKWEEKNYKGTLIATTGFGKTYTSILAIKGLISRKSLKRVVVVVPSIPLKEQWTTILKENNLLNMTRVFVVNTASKSDLITDLLIIDEYHTIGAPTFREVLNCIEYKYLLTLTATIKRQDGEHELLLEHSPIFDEVTLDECLSNNWISPYSVYNIPIAFNQEDQVEYDKLNNKFRHFAAKVRMKAPGEALLSVLSKWVGNGNKEESSIASILYNIIRKRKSVCINNINKIQITVDIVNHFNDRKTLIFTESIDFAEKISETIGSDCVAYHSKLKKKEKDDVKNGFIEGKYRILCCVKGLDAGFDVPDCSLGIIAAGNSTQLTNIQRSGRVIRYVEGKNAIIINLFSKSSIERKWLEKRQKNLSNITYIENIKELFSKYEK